MQTHLEAFVWLLLLFACMSAYQLICGFICTPMSASKVIVLVHICPWGNEERQKNTKQLIPAH